MDRFISYEKKVSNKTALLNLPAVRSYLGYHDIDIIPSKFKKKVTLPKLPIEHEQPIDVADVRKLLQACSNRRLKTYLLVLASGGMREIEASAIRIKDIDFSSPTRVHIRKEYAKTRAARDIYISDEAAHQLKTWIDWKHRNGRPKTDNDLVFSLRSENPSFIYHDLSQEFSKVRDLAGFRRGKMAARDIR